MSDYIEDYKKARRGIAVKGKTCNEAKEDFYKKAKEDIYWAMKNKLIDDRMLDKYK
jgi:hypothetical protein